MKICFKCKKEKPRSEFYTHKNMADGLLGKCKTCTKETVTKNRTGNAEYYREYDRKRGNRQNAEYRNSYREKYPNKYKAVTMVNNAIRDGKLFREPCEVCGCNKRPHGHHDDYSKPLNVRWLCAIHHKEWHLLNGEAPNG